MALYERHDDEFLPGPLTQGPWAEGAQHGGPPSALMAGEIEAAAAPGHRLARLTVELLRPVPLSRLRVRTELLRPGRNVQLHVAELLAGDTPVAQARGLTIRVGDDTPAQVHGTVPPPPGDGVAPDWAGFARSGYHDQAVEMRLVAGTPGELGPSTAWIRLKVAVVAGEEPTPAQRAVAVADFGNGISSGLDPERFTYINPDLTVALFRPPIGEWVALQAETHGGAGGVGLAESALWDLEGRVGRALQLLLLTEL